MRSVLARALAVIILAIAGAVPALAEDKTSCGKGMVCASDPQSVAQLMSREGYKAKLETDKQGDPSISSAASGYVYDVFFYGCADHKRCDSLQFKATFERGASSDVVSVNRWNRQWRFSQMSVDDDGVISLSYDVSTLGGLTAANFADVLAWWSSMLGEADKFFAKNRAAAASTPATPKN